MVVKISATNVLSSSDVFSVWIGLNERWPKTYSKLRKEIRRNKSKMGNIFEDFCVKEFRRLKGKKGLKKYYPLLGRYRPIKGRSTLDHQHDVIVTRPYVPFCILVECKYRHRGTISTSDVLAFHTKSLDVFYLREIRERQTRFSKPIKHLFRVFMTNKPLSSESLKFCLAYGILVIQPRNRLPAPIPVYYEMLTRAVPKSRIKGDLAPFLKDMIRIYELTFKDCASWSPEKIIPGDILLKKLCNIADYVKQIARQYGG